jgi:hypothetical protein
MEKLSESPHKKRKRNVELALEPVAELDADRDIQVKYDPYKNLTNFRINNASELPPELLAEWGDIRDVRARFGFRETFLYWLWRNGKIRGVLIPRAKGKRGKRLFSYASIRSYLEFCAEQEPLPGDTNRAGIALRRKGRRQSTAKQRTA